MSKEWDTWVDLKAGCRKKMVVLGSVCTCFLIRNPPNDKKVEKERKDERKEKGTVVNFSCLLDIFFFSITTV